MDNKIIAFPVSRAAKAARDLPRKAASIVSLDHWKDEPRPRRTPNGVFFITNVLTTPGDFA